MKRHLSMAALGAVLAASASHFAIIRAEAVGTADKIEELQTRLAELDAGMSAIQAKADAEKRPLSAEEEKEIDTLYAEFERIEGEIARRAKLAAARDRLSASLGRQTDPNFDPQAAQTDPADPAPAAARRPIRAALPAQPRDPAERDRAGFRTVGEFAQAIIKAAKKGGGMTDPRLVAIQNAAPSEYGSEGVGADGGFAVPPDFRATILKKVMGEESLLARTDQQQTNSNTMVFPKDETTPWQTSGGIQSYWEGEAGQYTPKKPALQSNSIRLNKLTALVPATDELLEDAAALTGYINSKAPEKMMHKVNDAIYRGTGAGMPLGILNAASLVTQDAESAQAADTINANNIVNMFARMYAPWRRNAVWLINQDLEPQLQLLAFPGSTTAIPLYMPPGGLSASPFGTLMGRPVMPMEICSALGDVGDICLVDFKQYLTATRVGGIRQQVSVHLWFDYDIMAFKFTLRIAGQPWWASTITRQNGSNALSWAVTLAAR